MNLDDNPLNHPHFNKSGPLDGLTIPELILLEQSGELSPQLAVKLTAWRDANREPAELLDRSIEALTRPLPDPGVPLHPLRRDHILKAGRSAHLERRREESVGSKAVPPAGKVLTPAWSSDEDSDSSRWTWLGAVAALAAVFLFGLYVVNRPGPDGVPGLVNTDSEPKIETVKQLPEAIKDPLAKEVPVPMLANTDAIEAFLHEPIVDFSSQLSELDQALFQSQVNISDESDWLAQLD